MTTLTFEQAQARLNYDQWFDYSERVAMSFARSYPGTDKADIKSEIDLMLVEKKEIFLAQDNVDSYIKVSMKHCATAFCKRERSAQMFFTDDYLYRPDDVRDLLQEHYEQTEKAWIPEDARTENGNDDVVMLVDIAQAVESLPHNYKVILFRKYVLDDVEEPKDRQTLSRAVRKVTEVLNTKRKHDMQNHEGPGARKVITNAHAMFNTKAVMA